MPWWSAIRIYFFVLDGIYHEFSFDQVCEIELWHKNCKGKRKMWFFAAETNLISSTTSKEANFRPQNWFESCVYSIVSVPFSFHGYFRTRSSEQKDKKKLVSKQSASSKTQDYNWILFHFSIICINLCKFDKWKVK